MAKNWKLQARQSRVDGLWYVTLAGGNGQKMLRSDGFQSEAEASALALRVKHAEIAFPGASVGPGTWWANTAVSFPDMLRHSIHLCDDKLLVAMRSGDYPRIDSAKRALEKMKNAMVVLLPPVGLKVKQCRTTQN